MKTILLVIVIVVSVFVIINIDKEPSMSKYYQVNIYADPSSYKYRKIFGVLIKDENPIDYFVRFNKNFGPEHMVNYTLVN